MQLCRKCQQHLSPATMSTLTSSHNATVQRLNDRVASANDALLKQQASHAEKDEALEQARLQLQQLQISTNGLKVLELFTLHKRPSSCTQGKARVLDIVSRELGARCEALGLEELPSVDLATWQSCVDTNSLPDHCIAMCRTLLQQVKALDLARDIALEVCVADMATWHTYSIHRSCRTCSKRWTWRSRHTKRPRWHAHRQRPWRRQGMKQCTPHGRLCA